MYICIMHVKYIYENVKNVKFIWACTDVSKHSFVYSNAKE